MANSDLRSFSKARSEGFAHGLCIVSAHAVADVHLPDIFRRDAENRLERRIYAFVDEAPSLGRAYYEEQIC
jgi:hypothetical protein